MKFILKGILHPATLFNGLLLGFLILVGVMHNHAHYTTEVDADSYVRNFCKKNVDKCERYVSDYE